MAIFRSAVVLAVAVAVLAGATGARADGDPASDVLFARDVFLPFTAAVSKAVSDELEASARNAKQAGRPIRVALIANPGDLGSVPSLFGHPSQYAQFLGRELQFVYHGELLVVMPQGAALSQNGRLVKNSAVGAASVPAGGNGLARTAIAIVRQLTGKGNPATAPAVRKPKHAAVHRVEPGAARPATGVAVWKATAIAVGGVLALLLLGAVAVRWRRNRLRAAEPLMFTPPDPNDPYAYREPW